MKAFTSVLLVTTLALVSCDSTGNTNKPETKDADGSITTPKQSVSDIPLHFKAVEVIIWNGKGAYC